MEETRGVGTTRATRRKRVSTREGSPRVPRCLSSRSLMTTNPRPDQRGLDREKGREAVVELLSSFAKKPEAKLGHLWGEQEGKRSLSSSPGVIRSSVCSRDPPTEKGRPTMWEPDGDALGRPAMGRV